MMNHGFTFRTFNIVAVAFVAALLLSSCVSVPSAQQRQEIAALLANSHHWSESMIVTQQFDLLSYRLKHGVKAKQLAVYIEGDGLSWISKNTLSIDPTPINPIALKLALNHQQGNAVYLARPCQYVGGGKARNCHKRYWSSSRFSEEVIAASNEAIDVLKAEFSATELQLVGFSGGGAIAALLAARRDDVVRLITIAGNLDHQAWTTYHKISALTGSLNPADYRQKLAKIEQIHFVGEDDKIMPPFLAGNFVAGLPDANKASVIVVPKQTHGCCWPSVWEALMSPLELKDQF